MRKFLLLSLLFVSLFAHAQMTVETFTLKATGDKITFLKYVPAGYDKTKKYPVLVSLSGDGEKASSGIAALQGSGINRLLIAGSLSLPFIVVSPQTPYANYDMIGPGQGVSMPGVFATEMLDTAIARYGGDPTKTYISGLSMGGPSVPNAMAFFPSRWAAGISMASWETDFPDAAMIKAALWDIKVDDDPIAGPPDYNIQFIQGCTNSKKAQYTVIHGSGHYIWDQVYSDSWEGLSLSTKYSGSTPQSNVYTWLAQFYTLGGPTQQPIQAPVQAPISTPTPVSYFSIPGKMEAESYSTFYNVKTEPCSDTGGTLDVGYIRAGSWMDYNVNVVSAGTYNLSMRVASTAAGTIYLKNSAGGVLDTISVPVTGGWQNWKTITSSVVLPSGNQTLRVYAQQQGFNLNWLSFAVANTITLSAPATISISNPTGAPITIGGTTFTSDFKLIVK
jgi:hypothetical protein